MCIRDRRKGATGKNLEPHWSKVDNDGKKTEGGTLALGTGPVSYTHLRAHETVLDLVCRLLLEKKNTK